VEREPARQQHDLDGDDRNHRPRHDAEQRIQDAREHVDGARAALREDRVARRAHVRVFRRIAGELQREICLHARAHVELSAVHERPSAMGALPTSQVIG
jgi:hypothetical protein